MNIVVVRGTLSSDPMSRELPSGSVVVSLEVTTERTDGGHWSVPIAWFDPPSPSPFNAGDEVVVVGAVRRRFFRVASTTQSRTEVVADTVVAAGDRRRVRTALQQCTTRLGVDPASTVRSRR